MLVSISSLNNLKFENKKSEKKRRSSEVNKTWREAVRLLEAGHVTLQQASYRKRIFLNHGPNFCVKNWKVLSMIRYLRWYFTTHRCLLVLFFRIDVSVLTRQIFCIDA